MGSVIKILSSNAQNIIANGKESNNNSNNSNNKKASLKKSSVKRVMIENEGAFTTITTVAATKKALNKTEEKSIEIKEIIDQQDEPLLKPNPRRFVLFPIQYHEV